MSMDSRPSVDFYFDFTCPWSYLALMRLRESALRSGSRINWYPVLVAEVLASANPDYPQDRMEPNPARAAWLASDLNAWATFCGLRIGRPGGWPAAGSWAARGAVVALAAGRIQAYAESVFAGYFAQGRDIALQVTVIELAVEAGLPVTEFTAGINDPASMETVTANTQALVRRGGFGTPSMFVADQLYFGNDRMPLVELALNQISDQRLIAPGQHGA